MTNTLANLGIEALTVFSLSPPQFINLAAELGCGHISTGLTSLPFGPQVCKPWSLKDDRKLRRETIALMADRGVKISLGEGFAVRPGADMGDREADLQLFRELGVTRINTVVMESDRSRAIDQIGTLVQMANTLGLETTLELPPTSVIGNFEAGVAAVKEIALPNLRLLIDSMHFIRSGSSIDELAVADPDLIGYVQLSDVPLLAVTENYMDEAMWHRLPPGEGELPLLELLKALPSDRVISLEVPSRGWYDAGDKVEIWAARCVAAARSLLEQLPA